MADTFQAAVVDKYTGNPADFHLAAVTRPQTIGDTQVEIQVHAASLNPIDYKRAEGMLSLMLPEKFPLKLGYDVAGTVTRVGTSVTRFIVGDRVYGRVRRQEVGTIAETVVVSDMALAKIPENVAFNTAAAVPLAGLTALQALEKCGAAEGKSVFVSGGMGGVGMFGVALAKLHFNASEVITTVSTAKISRVKEMGATRVVDYTKEDYTQVLENAADVVLDTIGDAASYKVARPHTKVVSVALLPDGNGLEYFRDGAPPLSFFNGFKFAVAKKLVSGIAWFLTRGFRAKDIAYEYVVMQPDGKALEDVFNPLLASGALKPAIANVHAFTDQGIQDAFRESREGHATGKIIICVKD
ncbi:hypothetical protein LPJ57_001154 [Coemansia sp. RSA 486]|nr:hypothetical protein LPJ57_001154 [Coemansia sp. RSA 486]KAJ2234051.1 hypothetical protein IWW45_003708 [Coemansia sp. RSA 485]